MGTKNTRALLAILAIAASLVGCSQEGDLIVKNDATTEFEGYIDKQYVMIAPGDQYSATIYIGKTLAFVGPKDLNVVVSGSAWTKKSFSEEVQVNGGEQATYVVNDDVGALNFKNNYNLSVNELRVKPCDSTTFGDNLLAPGHDLSPGDEILVQLPAGCYDIQVNFSREEILDTVEDVALEIGQVIDMLWDPDYVYLPPGSTRLLK